MPVRNSWPDDAVVIKQGCDVGATSGQALGVTRPPRWPRRPGSEPARAAAATGSGVAAPRTGSFPGRVTDEVKEEPLYPRGTSPRSPRSRGMWQGSQTSEAGMGTAVLGVLRARLLMEIKSCYLNGYSLALRLSDQMARRWLLAGASP